MAKPATLDSNGCRKFGFRDKLAYAAGDFGCNMSFALKGTMTIFWTQFMGIDSVVMAGLLLLVEAIVKAARDQAEKTVSGANGEAAQIIEEAKRQADELLRERKAKISEAFARLNDIMPENE